MTVMADAIRRLGPLGDQAADARGRLVAVLEALMAAEPLVTELPASESVAQWRHSIRDRVAAMTGWAAVMSRRPDEATIERGTAGIARGAVAVAELLARLPE
jgi:hypothetical protein